MDREIFTYTGYGLPKAWQRAGRCKTHYYDRQAQDKKNLRTIFLASHPDFTPLDIPLCVSFKFFFPRPKKTVAHHARRPDLSNLIKFYEDCFNNFLWSDDALICEYVDTYKAFDDIPRVEIAIYEA